MIRFASFLFVIPLCSLAWAQSKLPTVEEALELSAYTGRPIFAMAGRET